MYVFLYSLVCVIFAIKLLIMRKTSVTLLLALTGILFVLTSCGSKSRPFVVGVSQCSEDVWREKLNNELRLCAFSYDGMDLRISSAYDDVELQTRQINQFVASGVDLLIVAPGQVKVSEAIERAYNKGIPVIVFDRRTHSSKYTAYIGADNKEMGSNIAQYLLSQIKGSARILEICGLSTSSPAIDRAMGFDGEVAKHHNMHIVKRIECDWTEQCAYRLVDSLLSVDRVNFDYVFAHNDRMAMGARKAAKKHGVDLSKVQFLGIDAMPQDGGGMQLVRDGELLASYIYPTRGDEVMKLAYDILNKKPYKRENLLSSALVTRDNASVLLMQNNETAHQVDNLMSLRNRVVATTNAFDTQRSYLFMLIFLVCLLFGVCAFAVKAYIAKTRFNKRLQESMAQQKQLTADMERMTQTQLRFFTNVSHELRTPLTLISGPADQLAERNTIKGEDRNLVEMIRRNVKILSQLVDEILEFRRIQNDKVKLKLNQFDINSELQVWESDFAAVAARKKLTLEYQSTGSAMVIADKEKLSHIYFNLMTNALKYTPQGGSVTTGLEITDSTFRIFVADTGNGMNADDCQHIFERFYQAKGSVGGTGIGLAIVKAYTDLHHGKATVDSQLGQGTTFSIELPLQQAGYDAQKDTGDIVCRADNTFADDYMVEDVKSRQNTETLIAVNDNENEKPLVLVVDDNASMRNYIKSILQPQYNVIDAQNGAEALEEARKKVPQIVVSDVMMPVMNGLELSRRMKDDITISHIPVILLTARVLDEQRAEGYATGADSYITKPFAASTLLARIDNLLKNRRQLKRIFSGTLQEQAEDEQMLGERDKTFVAQLRKIIKSHIPDADYSVEDMGGEIGLSRVQLYRKVKALTGYSVVDLLRKARLARAKYLLETTDKTVQEVAYCVGFTTPSYFAKRFKEEFGISPGDVNR